MKKIGMRTIKTTLAVSLTILASRFLYLESPFYAGIAAVMAVKTSVSESFTIGKNRMLGTMFGATIGLIVSYIAPINFISIGIGILVIIYTCNLLGWKNSIQISTIVFLAILLNYEKGSRLNYSLYRTIDTLVGLAIGTLINYFIIPPNYKNHEFIMESSDRMYSEYKEQLENIIWKNDNFSLEELKLSLNSLEKDLNNLKKDTKLKRKKQCDYSDIETMLNTFDNIYNHFSIVSNMERVYCLNEDNKESLEKLFNKEIPPQKNNGENKLEVVFNYHISKIIEAVYSIDNK